MEKMQKRRGISSVIGAVFMILVMVGALNVMIWAMQQQDRVTETIIEKSNSNLNKLNEDIDISNVRIDGDKLNMTVTNTGGAAATLKSLYIVNETANEQYRYDIDLVVDGRESLKDIGQDVPLIITDNTEYSVRLITESGNSVATTLTPLSAVALPMSLYIIPPTVSPGNNVTVLFTVTHNITDSNLAWEITPWIDPDCDAGCTLTLQGDAPSPALITKGNTILFKWTYLVETTDQVEHRMSFNASLENAKEGNFIIEKGLAKLVEGAQISYQSEIVIANDLVQKPEMFLIIPSPFGESGEEGLWGIVVVNPTEYPMQVSRVILNVYTSNANANQKMIESSQCDTSGPSIELRPINPASGWSCPHDNMIEWKNVATPEEIDGYSAETFLFRYEPGSLTAGDEPAFMISAGVFSSLGQFTKTGLSSSMSDTAMSVANVYLTDTDDEGDAVDQTHMFGNLNGFEHNTEITLNVTLADLDTVGTTVINDGAKLIINVPRGFTDVQVVDSTGFDTGANEPQILLYGDGTTQIIATVNGNLGDVSQEARILSFTATTPIVEGTKIYIMHVHADGETSAGWSVGPSGQIALQVCEDLNNC